MSFERKLGINCKKRKQLFLEIGFLKSLFKHRMWLPNSFLISLGFFFTIYVILFFTFQSIVHTFNPCIGLGIVQYFRLFCAIWESISRPSNNNHNRSSFKQWAVKINLYIQLSAFLYIHKL